MGTWHFQQPDRHSHLKIPPCPQTRYVPNQTRPTASPGSPLISDRGLAPLMMTRAVAGPTHLTHLSLPSAHGPASPSPAEHPHPACLLLPVSPAMAARVLFPSDTLNRSQSPCSTTDTDSLPAEQRARDGTRKLPGPGTVSVPPPAPRPPIMLCPPQSAPRSLLLSSPSPLPPVSRPSGTSHPRMPTSNATKKPLFCPPCWGGSRHPLFFSLFYLGCVVHVCVVSGS